MSIFFGADDAKAVVKFFRQRLEDHIRGKGKLGVHIAFQDPTDASQLLYEESIFGDAWKDIKGYDVIARGKASLSAREKMHSGDVPKCLLRPGDVIYRGGAYYNGFSVGISGLVSEDDQDWSMELAEHAEVLAGNNFRAWKEQNENLAFVQ